MTPRAVRALIALGGLASLVHFADNATSMSRYPEPSWITPAGVWISWIPVGALCIYLVLKKRSDRSFQVGAVVFGVVLMAGLLHFAFGSMAMLMSPISMTTVFAEAACGVALLIALWRTPRVRS